MSEPLDLAFHAISYGSGIVGALGLLYLLYLGEFVVGYARFFRFVFVGLVVFGVSAPLTAVFAPSIAHAVHAVTMLFVVFALYDLLRSELEREEFGDFGF